MMKAMSKFSAANSLIISCLLWLLGFIFIAICGFMTQHQFFSAALGLTIMSIAVGAYQPPSAAIVAELAPPDALAIYYSINSSCWAFGGMIGPPLVLGAMDKFPQHTPYIWLVMSLSTLIPASMFYVLERKMRRRGCSSSPDNGRKF
jgi:MFS family permease